MISELFSAAGNYDFHWPFKPPFPALKHPECDRAATILISKYLKSFFRNLK
jgi:hypothetical protein